MKLDLCPVTLREARAFVDANHRHHRAPQGGLFAVAVLDMEAAAIIGVAIIGKPVARALDSGYCAEVTRVCVLEGYPNACSMLYAAAWRAARALGYERLITYTLLREPGTSLRAAGWKVIGKTRGESWNRPSRPRVDKHPTDQKAIWERTG